MMPTGYPFRVAIWRRVLLANPKTVRRFTLGFPALLGGLLLLGAVPAIKSLLETEIRLLESGVNHLKIETDCEDLRLTVVLRPAHFEGIEGESDRVRQAQAMSAARLMDFLEGRIPAETLVFVLLQETKQDPGCRFAQISIPAFTGEKPTPSVLNEGGRREAQPAAETEDGEFRLDLVEADTASVRFRWPGLYRYSHEGFGLFNRLLGKTSAGTSFLVEWEGPLLNPEPEGPGLPLDPRRGGIEMDAELHIVSPRDYQVSYVSEFLSVERSQNGITYFNRQDPRVGVPERLHDYIRGGVRFRVRNYEGRMNYLLLAGGSIIGLGVTLLVESLIASLFRFEQLFSKAERRRSRPGRRGRSGERLSKPAWPLQRKRPRRLKVRDSGALNDAS